MQFSTFQEQCHLSQERHSGEHWVSTAEQTLCWTQTCTVDTQWDGQSDPKQRTHKRKVKECRHLPSTQNGDPEVADLMPLTAKGHECFTKAQLMLAVRCQAEFTDKRSQWRAILDPPRYVMRSDTNNGKAFRLVLTCPETRRWKLLFCSRWPGLVSELPERSARGNRFWFCSNF